MPEAGRAIIQDQVSIGGNALPWSDRIAFSELMLSWEMRSYRAALAMSGPLVFDRGVPDVAGYLRLIGSPVPRHVDMAARKFRYHPRIFIAPPWQEIFRQDVERKQSFDEAEATYRALVEVYTAFEYDLVHLPLASVSDRLQFVIEMIGPMAAETPKR
jgi:predicted ATPase